MHFLALELGAEEVKDSHTSEVPVLLMRILKLPAAMQAADALMHLGSPWQSCEDREHHVCDTCLGTKQWQGHKYLLQSYKSVKKYEKNKARCDFQASEYFVKQCVMAIFPNWN